MTEHFPHAAGQPPVGFKSRGITARFHQVMEIVAMAMAIFTLSSVVHAATYYVDFAGGADGNNATNKATPWKHHPYMTGWTGSYSHRAGDSFIFRGGVTWNKTCLPMTITSGGSASAQDYYGVDQSWFAGDSWARPIFSAQNNGTNSAVGTNLSNWMLTFEAGYITVDNFEFTGFYWDQFSGSRSVGMIHTYYSGVLTNLHVLNCYLHNWTHGAVTTNLTTGPALTSDNFFAIAFTGSPNTSNPGTVVSNCVIANALDASGYAPGEAINGYIDLITHNTISNVCNAILPASTNTTVCYNNIGPLEVSFPNYPEAQHPNAIESLAIGGYFSVHDNYIHDTHPADTSIIVIFSGGNAGDSDVWIYNNVCWNVGRACYDLDNRGGATIARVFNNTFAPAPKAWAMQVTVPGKTNIASLYATNNLCISTIGMASGGFTAYNTNHNLVLTPALAAAGGFTAATKYAPTSSAAPTVDTGAPTAYATDILGVSRPQGAAWDIGAYEYKAQGGGAASILVVPAGLNFGSIPVGTNADQSLTVQNTGTGTFSGSASVAVPFSIISGGGYTLAAGQSQVVTVRFTPTKSGLNSQAMSFSGGSGATATVSGVALLPPPQNLHFPAGGP